MINTAAIGQVRRSCPVFIWYVLLKRNSPTERTIAITTARINAINPSPMAVVASEQQWLGGQE
ncbi:hypothetical protein, partial [Pseudomonas aeruginosa]|uniref:hypothetical protein n=1 Tax=Pseudomonas aeruginosa TaxID=287 RepID=UPI00301E411A